MHANQCKAPQGQSLHVEMKLRCLTVVVTDVLCFELLPVTHRKKEEETHCNFYPKNMLYKSHVHTLDITNQNLIDEGPCVSGNVGE